MSGQGEHRSSKGRKRGKGGKVERRKARKRLRKLEIACDKAETFVLAAAHAYNTGRPLNRHITIHFAANGCPIPTCDALAQFLKSAADWLRTRGAPVAYIWTIENPAHADEHAHILIHVPEALKERFSQLQRGWLCRSGTRFGTRAICTKPAADTLRARKGLIRYLLKGADREACRIFRINCEPQGPVEGKRCGTSSSLGASARARENGVLGPSERPTGSNGASDNLREPETPEPSLRTAGGGTVDLPDDFGKSPRT